MRFAARKDANATEIVKGLRAVGVKVTILSQKDIPDLLCGYKWNWWLLEIKDAAKSKSARKLRPGQQRFMNEHAGYPVAKIESLDQAFEVLGVKVR